MKEWSIKPPLCPECDKMYEVKEESQNLGEFLDWLRTVKGFVLGSWKGDENHAEKLFPISETIECLLAEYFNIDLEEMEKERQNLLKYYQDLNN